jgi:hypothetical protein
MTDLAPIESGPLTLFGWATPRAIVLQATEIANEIAPLIRERNLVKRIGQSEHVYLEGWTLAGTMLGVFATTVRTWEIGSDEGYGATVEARTLTGQVVGRADAVVMRSEAVGTDPKTGEPKRKWLDAPAFQLISMAQTRASSKALRMPLGFVMKLAGYDTTPAEEMEAAAARGETVSGGKGVKAGWRDIGDQTRAHQRLDKFVADTGLGEWVAVWLDSKGYMLPLSKPQMSDLRRAVDRELEEREEQQAHEDGQPAQAESHPARAGAPTSAVGPHSPRGSTADQTSGEGRAEREREGTHVDSAMTPSPDSHPQVGD